MSSQRNTPSRRGEGLELAAISVENWRQFIMHVQVLARHGALGPAENIGSQDSRRGRDVDQIYVVKFIRNCDLYTGPDWPMWAMVSDRLRHADGFLCDLNPSPLGRSPNGRFC